MVEAAVASGYIYVAFTDHGEDLAINGSTREEMLAHRDRIRALEAEHPGIRLLFGCELNIGPKGELDYDPEFRLEFDYCVASIHSHFDLSQAAQTARILTALADPAVNAIGHLSGRYIGRRPGVELDIDVVLEALAVTGVALEINGALDRLDASAEVARLAMARDVDFVIDTDSHHVVRPGADGLWRGVRAEGMGHHRSGRQRPTRGGVHDLGRAASRWVTLTSCNWVAQGSRSGPVAPNYGWGPAVLVIAGPGTGSYGPWRRP